MLYLSNWISTNDILLLIVPKANNCWVQKSHRCRSIASELCEIMKENFLGSYRKDLNLKQNPVPGSFLFLFFYLLFCSMRFGFAFDWYHLLKIEEMRKNKRLKTSKCSQNVHWVNLLKTNFRSVNSSEIQTQEPKALDWFFKNSSPTLKFLVNQAWLGWVQNLPNSIHPKVWTPT